MLYLVPNHLRDSLNEWSRIYNKPISWVITDIIEKFLKNH